jgi:DNA-binding transcriptional regulator YiaG
MRTLRDCREATQSSQAAFAERLGVSLQSYRMWDAGRRPVPGELLVRARAFANVALPDGAMALLALAPLLGVSVFRLREAARDGRLAVSYDRRVVFGRLVPRATLAAGKAYKSRFYNKRKRWVALPAPPEFAAVPEDYDRQVVALRQDLGLSQIQLAQRIGAAGRAVIYQWESRKRRPSPLLWQRVLALETGHTRSPIPLS